MAFVDAHKKLLLLEKMQMDTARGLCEQPVSTFDTYKEAVGLYRGLGVAITELRREVDEDADL